jgi:formyltetrahydrofolate deformylase
MTKIPGAILNVVCPDRPGLVAMFANFVHSNGGNILNAEHHRDDGSGLFVSRLDWTLEAFKLSRTQLEAEVAKIAHDCGGVFKLFYYPQQTKVAIFVSKQDHCLFDLLIRFESGELLGQVVCIFSNHPELDRVAKMFNIPFFFSPAPKGGKIQHETRAKEVVKAHGADLIVLAKYMQILSPDFLENGQQIINIHHSFLPAFPGAQPYHNAYKRGVKVIGATAHYVTAELDAGPIIEQDIIRIDHRFSVADMIREGRDIERVVLARAVRWHLERRVIVFENKTAIFA